ncbi:MAG TPA: SCP2 sterol-binding domain-containing protein [Acidimicrobiales bacterium]|nr:SCP2 sterol-binding domain-containing protein [Acidimicrobiales bacterium]
MPARDGSSKRKPEDAVTEFFDLLAAKHHEPLFEGDTATIRFDVKDGRSLETWYLTVKNGDVGISHKRAGADAVVRMERGTLEMLVDGRHNAMAALLRGLMTIEGSMGAMVMFQRVLPGPPEDKGRVPPITGATVMAQRRPT